MFYTTLAKDNCLQIEIDFFKLIILEATSEWEIWCTNCFVVKFSHSSIKAGHCSMNFTLRKKLFLMQMVPVCILELTFKSFHWLTKVKKSSKYRPRFSGGWMARRFPLKLHIEVLLCVNCMVGRNFLTISYQSCGQVM